MTPRYMLSQEQDVPDHSADPSGARDLAAAPVKKRRGFANMDTEQHRAAASEGGRNAHALGRAHQFTEAEARAAGKKGGEKVSQDREYMAALGRKGALARTINRFQASNAEGARVAEKPVITASTKVET